MVKDINKLKTQMIEFVKKYIIFRNQILYFYYFI